jgi:hypothetical protein|tara:strand:- start:10 stop:234 length:225 start_codon:yes stop_codon:yes gene_type:complete
MTGDLTTMFIVGSIIFGLYLFGLLTMITKAHKQQRKELEDDPELKGFDWNKYNSTYTIKPSTNRRKYKKRNKTV